MTNYIGLKWIDRDGDRLTVYGFNNEENLYLSRFDNSTHQFADSFLTEQELMEELEEQSIRGKFYQHTTIL